MKKILVKLCDFLEKKLYNEPTVTELMKTLDKTRYRLYEANCEIARLQEILKQIARRR